MTPPPRFIRKVAYSYVDATCRLECGHLIKPAYQHRNAKTHACPSCHEKYEETVEEYAYRVWDIYTMAKG